MIEKALSGFGQAVAVALKNVFPDLAKNALKIDNTTESQIVAGVTKTHVGLGSVENFPIQKTHSPGTVLSSTVLTVPRVVKRIIDPIIDGRFLGEKGKVVFAISNTPMDVSTDFPIHDVGVCTGTTERDACLAAKVLPVVYERSEHRLWTLSAGAYTEQAKANIAFYIKPNRWYVNRQTGKLFYARTLTLMVAF